MLDNQKTWSTDSEENLARSWEQRIRPRKRRRRVASPWLRTVAWIGGLWSVAVVASLLAIHVMMLSYQYDQMNQQYAGLTRQNQALSSTVANLTSAQSLQNDATRLKVSLVIPQAQPVRVSHGSATTRTTTGHPLGRVTGWLQKLSHSLGQ